MTALFQFLQESKTFPKVYWKSRNTPLALAGYGTGTGSLTFGGHAFTPQSCTGLWNSFPSSFFFSPAEIKQELWKTAQCFFSLPALQSRIDNPSFETWWTMVENALSKIEEKQFKKIVLARQTTLTFAAKLDPFQVLRMLAPLGDQTSLFLLQLDENTAFLGATPETLFHRKDRKISTEALAGTKVNNESWTSKESDEVEAVQLFLQEKLLTLCRDIHAYPLGQKTFGNLTHLYQCFEGELKDDISDEQLFFHLHPTPALGGLPKEKALDYLSMAEPFGRGWYGGTFGVASPQETDMAVAIRSALIQGNQMHLFAGAGIVHGSQPDKEWKELDRKIGHYMRHL